MYVCVVWYGMVWYGTVWYGMVWYGMVWYGMVWYVCPKLFTKIKTKTTENLVVTT